MIPVEEADNLIKDNLSNLSLQRRSLITAFGEVLQEDICADRDLPPYHRVAMDGIAIDFDAWQKGIRSFTIQGIQQAGEAVKTLESSGNCFEVMTGAVLPEKTNCVIKVEDIEIVDKLAQLPDHLELELMQNVHQKGSDHPAGSLIMPKGSRLLAPQIAVAASVGKTEVMISRKPSVAIVSTGDELVDLGEKTEPFQIRRSNPYAIQCALTMANFPKVDNFHIPDNQEQLYAKLEELLANYDLLILSGGVSKGKFDYVPSILTDLGVKKIFHKIRQKPGKPLWFGISKEQKPVFALPGNPVSALVCFYRYILLHLNERLGFEKPAIRRVRLAEKVRGLPQKTYFLPVKFCHEDKATLEVIPVYTNGSGDFSSLVKSDGFIELPAATDFEVGQELRFFDWKI